MTGAQVTGRAELPRHHAGCFACGDGPGGLRMRFADPGPDSDGRARVTGAVVVADAHEGAPGLAHGGVLATAMDELFGALQHHLDGHFVTAELTTRYRAPVPLGTTLHLDAVIESVDGRKLWVRGTGRLDAPDGTVAVSATALFLGVTLDHFRRYAPEGTRFRERHAR